MDFPGPNFDQEIIYFPFDSMGNFNWISISVSMPSTHFFENAPSCILSISACVLLNSFQGIGYFFSYSGFALIVCVEASADTFFLNFKCCL